MAEAFSSKVIPPMNSNATFEFWAKMKTPERVFRILLSYPKEWMRFQGIFKAACSTF